jgi:hypothetical protein
VTNYVNKEKSCIVDQVCKREFPLSFLHDICTSVMILKRMLQINEFVMKMGTRYKCITIGSNSSFL